MKPLLDEFENYWVCFLLSITSRNERKKRNTCNSQNSFDTHWRRRKPRKCPENESNWRVDLQNASSWTVMSQRLMVPAEVEWSKQSAVGWKPTLSMRLCLWLNVHSGLVMEVARPFGGICQIFTRQSCDPVARIPSWNGENSRSVTVSECAWRRGIVLLFLPQSSIGSTARLVPGTQFFF